MTWKSAVVLAGVKNELIAWAINGYIALQFAGILYGSANMPWCWGLDPFDYTLCSDWGDNILEHALFPGYGLGCKLGDASR